jgi:hypothetical protein
MSKNGAIGKVVLLGFEEQQKIGEPTKVHQRNEVIDMLDVGGCDLDCLLQEIGRLKKLYNLNLNNRLFTLPECIKEMKYLTRLDVSGCGLDCLPQGMG